MDTSRIKAPDEGFSYIMPIGYCNSPSCGYCHGKSDDGRPKKRYSYYASTRSLSPSLYQNLVDRCWRRSGTLLYRPNQRHSCCPHYTLRLDASVFHATRDQRQAVNRFNRYIIGDSYTKEAARLNPRSREETRRRDTVFNLAERIHEAESNQLAPLSLQASRSQSAKKPPTETEATAAATAATIEPAHKLEVTLEEDVFTEEKYDVFENYQRIVHKESPSKITRKGFTSFLCNSPLRRGTFTDVDGTERKVGSYHQCYRLDGKIVAIGVLDLLPHCVSAVYFLYHEVIHKHSPGKLGALREIALAREEGYRWWYSGYYIHSCPKMRYKIDYAPQYVLDPENLYWDLLDKDALAIFDRQPYVSLSRERRLAEEAGASDEASQKDRPKAVKVEEGEDDTKAGAEYANGSSNTHNNNGNGNDSDVDCDNEDDETNDSDDDDEGGSDAEDSGELDIPLLTSTMPGLPSLDEMAKVDLDEIPIRTSLEPGMFPVKYLAVWPTGSLRDSDSFKCKVAELVAAMGPDLMPHLCLDFRRHEN